MESKDLKTYTESNWISVNDSLPNKGEEDLIVDAKHPNNVGIGDYNNSRGWSVSGSNYYEPTHWIKIPKFNQ